MNARAMSLPCRAAKARLRAELSLESKVNEIIELAA